MQEQACYCLQELQLMEKLSTFSPILCGTIPLNIHLPHSDLDIICHAPDFQDIEQTVCEYYAQYPDFSIHYAEIRKVSSFIASFTARGFLIEVFAQHLPVKQQYAFRHMVTERRVLDLADEHFRKEIISLKSEGIKTEPAFARLLGLSGDPYDALLTLETCSDEEILSLLS